MSGLRATHEKMNGLFCGKLEEIFNILFPHANAFLMNLVIFAVRLIHRLQLRVVHGYISLCQRDLNIMIPCLNGTLIAVLCFRCERSVLLLTLVFECSV